LKPNSSLIVFGSKVVFLSFRAEPIIEVIPKIKYGMALIRAMVSGVIAKEGAVRCVPST
jgi:hypothetical protein